MPRSPKEDICFNTEAKYLGVLFVGLALINLEPYMSEDNILLKNHYYSPSKVDTK